MEKYSFVSKDPKSTVYKEVSAFLETYRENTWKRSVKGSERYHLIFGERNKLPFAKLGYFKSQKQLVNYFRGSDVICRKSTMVKFLQNHCNCNEQAMFDWLPLSFVIYPKDVQIHKFSLPGGNISEQTTHRNDERENLRTWTRENTRSKAITWIMKPTAGAKGDGIYISQDAEELISKVDSTRTAHVIQQYIHRPLLLLGKRKFDIRCWVLLDASYTAFLYKEGVLRTASEPYNPDDLSDVTAHLTNHNLQEEQSPNFGHYEEGNEMFFDEFRRILIDHHGVDMDSCIVPQMKKIIRDIFDAIKEYVMPGGDFLCFQLFGFDFLLDDQFKVWLLEVNGAPACARKLLPQLASSLVQRAVDTVFPPFECPECQENLFQEV